MPTLYCLQKCLHRDFLILQGFSTILFSNFFVCKQIANILPFSALFWISQNCSSPYFMGYLPQQFLYFLPEPQILSLLIYIVYIVFIVLFVFQGFHGQVTIYIYSIYSIYFIISIYLLRTICEHCSQYFILLINGSWTW